MRLPTNVLLKSTLNFLVILFCANAFALTYQVIGPCSEQAVYQGSYSEAAGLSVGKASMLIFDRDHIAYIGAEKGMNSILGTPVGEEELEIINRQEMRAYGWCFQIDGKTSSEMPDEVKLTGNENLKWFYGYAYYKSGVWVSYCTPTYTIRPERFCPTH